MYKVNLNYYLKELINHQPDKSSGYNKLFKNLAFKLEKNIYHFENLKNIYEGKDVNNFQEMLPIYFEIESLFVSLRSSVDMLLHLINYSVDLKIKNYEITLNEVYHHNKLPKNIKSVFNSYTRKRNNPTWNFIYTFRNDIVHENGIYELTEFETKLIGKEEYLFITIRNQEKEILGLFKICFNYIDTFTNQLLKALILSSKNA